MAQAAERRSSTAENGFRELDDLVLHLKGLVLVSRLREQRGAEAGELLMYRAELERVRDQLANLVRTSDVDRAAA